jgi:tripartite-type tricarboxylate transporter receptor subunit TctC
MKIGPRLTAIVVGLSLAGTLVSVGPAQADYPSQPIHIVVAWPAGGGHDIVARLIGQELSGVMGVPVVVDNVTGAGGATGMRHLETSAPDGYTIGIMGMHAISQSFMNTNATTLDRLDPLVYVSDEPGALQVLASTGVTTLADYIARMQADPGALLNGNDPSGGNSFVFANAIAAALDVDIIQVPYMGHAPTVTGLITGEVQTATLPLPPVLEHARAGTVNVLAVAAPARHHLLPDVPTFTELGHDLVVNDFIMVVAPVGIPAEVRARLEAGVLAAVTAPGFSETATRNGMMLRQGGSDLARTELAAQVEIVYPLLEAGGLVEPSLRRN